MRIARIPTNETTDFCSKIRETVKSAWWEHAYSNKFPEHWIDELEAVKKSATQLATDLACLDSGARFELGGSLAVNTRWKPGDLTKAYPNGNTKVERCIRLPIASPKRLAMIGWISLRLFQYHLQKTKAILNTMTAW